MFRFHLYLNNKGHLHFENQHQRTQVSKKTSGSPFLRIFLEFITSFPPGKVTTSLVLIPTLKLVFQLKSSFTFFSIQRNSRPEFLSLPIFLVMLDAPEESGRG